MEGGELERERVVKIIGTALCVLIYAPLGLWILTSDPGPRRRPCPECAAVANLAAINTAEVTYLASSGDGSYGTMADLIAAKLLDDTFNGTKFGYNYSIDVDATGYTVTALPASRKHGRYGYYTASDAFVRYMDKKSEECAPCFPEGKAGKRVE